jgi:hypothetical protein
MPTLTEEELYPRPVELPPSTERPLSELLSEYESVLESLSPSAHAALQPGLSGEELDRLEMEFSIVLSADMRALYSWRNGSDTSRNVCVFPYMHFYPLKDALAHRDHFRNSVRNARPEAREITEEWLSHCYPWVCVLKDGSMGGCFYDPERRDEASCFFEHSADGGGYTFYPSIGNYIAQLLECHRRQHLSADKGGMTLNGNWTSDQYRAFENQFGSWVEQFGPE